MEAAIEVKSLRKSYKKVSVLKDVSFSVQKGTVFALLNNGSGAYTLDTLVTFTGSNGAYPAAGLSVDAAGDLFGTTSQGGAEGNGTVFELTNTGFVASTATPPLSP